MTKKIHSKHDLELCYLRHQYLKRANINPSKEDFAPYLKIINGQAGKTYSTYKKLFFSIGFDFVDIVRIGEAHLVSFLGLFHIEHDIKKYNKFVEIFCEKNSVMPNKNDILDKNKANFTCFLKQRMEELVRICRQRIKNIRGVPMQEFHIFSGIEIPEVENDELIANHAKYGLKKVDSAIFRAIKKKAKPQNELSFVFNNTHYIAIPTNYKPLELIDFHHTVLDPREMSFNRNPEEVILMSESTKKWDRKLRKFKKTPSNQKIDMVRSFIENNKDNSVFEEELHIAKKMLARLDN